MRRFVAAVFLVVIGPGLMYADPLNPLNFSSLGTVTLGAGSWTLNTNNATITGPSNYTGTIDQAAGEDGVAVFSFGSLSVSSGATITVTGSLPVAFLASGNLTFGGVLNADGANAYPTNYETLAGGSVAGGFGGGIGQWEYTLGGYEYGYAGSGYGGGGYGNGGGGGGFGGSGGAGGYYDVYGGAPYGNILTKLVGGSGGGGGSTASNCSYGGSGGGGGGCVELGALGTVSITGQVMVAGGNGIGYATGGGGGSGGGVLIHGSSVSISGTIYANGGSGGNGWVAGYGAAAEAEVGGKWLSNRQHQP